MKLKTVGLIVGGILLADILLVDHLQVRGRVVDGATGEGINSAWVVIDLVGSEPLFNPPIPPHPNHRTQRCIGQMAVQTDSSGHFYLSQIGMDHALADKSASWKAFAPGYISGLGSSQVRSSVIALPPRSATARLAQGPGEKLTITPPAYRLAERLPPTELSASRELLEAVSFAFEPGCGEGFTNAHLAAAYHAASIAQTFNERMRVRDACHDIKSRIAAVPDAKPWPFDCDNLPFKYEPSPEVLAVEAEIKAMEARPR
jgi:hypothetical protein